MTNFRAAYAAVSVQFISALGENWSSTAKTNRDGSAAQGLTQLDLSFCKLHATDDATVVCETLAHALGQCSNMRILALAGFAAMRPHAVVGDTAVSHHPADVVIETVLARCTYLTDLNCSETDIGAAAVASTLLQLGSPGSRSKGQINFLGMAHVNFSGCRRLGGETFVALLRVCPNLIDLNLGYCCNEDHVLIAKGTTAEARAHQFSLHNRTNSSSMLPVTRVITDSDLRVLAAARCAAKLQGLFLGGMGSRSDVPWPTVGSSVDKAFSNSGVAAALTMKAQRETLSALQTIDLSHSAVTNSTMVDIALCSRDLRRLNVVGSKCTRELHRMLREAGCYARVFGV